MEDSRPIPTSPPSMIMSTFPEWGTWLNEDIESAVVPEGNVAMWWLGCTGIWMKTPGNTNITIDFWNGNGKRTHGDNKMKVGHQMANMCGGRLMQPNLRNIPFVCDPFAFKHVDAVLATHYHQDHMSAEWAAHVINSGMTTTDENGNNAIAIRKHPIKKVTDLTLENIQHLEPWEVLDLISRNMGTGWKGLPLAIQDIIESAFFVDCTIMPANMMRREGGIIDRRKEDGYEVLEIERGTWIEGIFMKLKPKVEKVHIDYSIDDEEDGRKKRRKHKDEDEDNYDDEIEMEEEEEDMDDEELKRLDGDDEEEIDDEEPDENNLQIEDIDAIDDIADEEE